MQCRDCRIVAAERKSQPWAAAAGGVRCEGFGDLEE